MRSCSKEAREEFMRTTRAFSSEVDTGSRKENASKQKDRAPFRFHRNGKGSRSHLVSASLVVLAAFAVAPAWAADVNVTSAVDAVTVYPDGASVTRVIALDLPAGDTTLVAKDFPLTLD